MASPHLVRLDPASDYSRSRQEMNPSFGQRPHVHHLATTQQPHIHHTATTRRPDSNHTVAVRLPHGGHTATTRRLHTDHTATARRPHGDHTATTPRPHIGTQRPHMCNYTCAHNSRMHASPCRQDRVTFYHDATLHRCTMHHHCTSHTWCI